MAPRAQPATGTSPGQRGGTVRRRARQDRQEFPPCHRCRSRQHSPSRCWARSRRCFQCGSLSHVREACRINGPNRAGRVGQLEGDDVPGQESPATEEEDGAEVYQLYYQTSAPRKSHPPLYVDIKLTGREVRAELDTGAAASVCSVEQFRTLFPEGGPEIKRSHRRLCTYGGDSLVLRGEVIVCVQYRSDAVNLPLIVC